jgi:hypothetical protein
MAAVNSRRVRLGALAGGVVAAMENQPMGQTWNRQEGQRNALSKVRGDGTGGRVSRADRRGQRCFHWPPVCPDAYPAQMFTHRLGRSPVPQEADARRTDGARRALRISSAPAAVAG